MKLPFEPHNGYRGFSALDRVKIWTMVGLLVVGCWIYFLLFTGNHPLHRQVGLGFSGVLTVLGGLALQREHNLTPLLIVMCICTCLFVGASTGLEIYWEPFEGWSHNLLTVLPLLHFSAFRLLGRRRGIFYSAGFTLLVLLVFVPALLGVPAQVEREELWTVFHRCWLLSVPLMLGLYGTEQNIEQQAMARATIEAEARLAQLDALTGLHNRRALQQELERLMLQGQTVTLFFIDLDRFKHINDTHGHQAGDQVLCHVAAALKSSVRASDLVARISGDEFAVVVYGTRDETVLENIAHKMMEHISQPVQVGEHPVTVTASLGIYRNLDANRPLKDALKAADALMYQAKKAGKNTFRMD